MFRRPINFLVLFCFALGLCNSTAAAGLRIKKVLPHFIDFEGRTSLSPSLYERDAYQFLLRTTPEKRAGLRFDVQWKGASKGRNLSVEVEMRGVLDNDVSVRKIKIPVEKSGWFSNWSAVVLRGKNYEGFGDLIAWRATLWDGNNLISEQKSFLW